MFGVSFDDVESQARFHEAQELNFALLSDPDGSAARKFGVAMEGRPFARRVTFVIDDKGVLRDIDEKVNVRQHGEELAKRIQAMRN